MARRQQYSDVYQDAQGRWWGTSTNDDTGDSKLVQLMPESRQTDDGDVFNSYRPVTALETLGTPGQRMYTTDFLENNRWGDVTIGEGLVKGDRLQLPSGADWSYLHQLGLSGAGSSPDPTKGLGQFLSENNLTLPQYQAKYGGLPLVFNNDGTVTYDPAAQTRAYDYQGTGDGWFHQIMPIVAGGLFTAGLSGMLPGTESIFGGSAATGSAGGAMDMGVGLGGDLGSLGGITPVTDAVGSFLNTTPVTFGQEAATQLGGLTSTTPTGAVTGLTSTLPAGGFDALMTGTGLQMLNPVTGLPMAIDAAGNTLTQQIGGLSSELTTMTPTADLPILTNPSTPTTPKTPSTPTNTVGATTAASSLLKTFNDTFGTNLTQGDLDLIGKGLGLGLGYLGSKEQADAMQNLYNQQVSLGAPYRAELANLNANPSSFYNSDMFKGALQQGSDALARSLSAKVGNPILNPTALQEMQNYTTKGSLDAYNQRWNQLSSAGQLGLGAVPNLGSAAAQASGNTYNAIGAGLGSVFGNQRDYAGEYLDLIRRQQQGGSNYPLP